MVRLTAYQSYRRLSWTSDNDECEASCGCIMSEDRYVEGELGHYCSQGCLEAEEGEAIDLAPDEHYLESSGRGHSRDREDFHSDG